MSNLNFWRSSVIYNGITITTYYLAEINLWLFRASDIFNVFDKLYEGSDGNCDTKIEISKPIPKNQICVFQNNVWESVDVLQKEDILEVTKSSNSEKIRNFDMWIDKVCSNAPEDYFLSKDCKEYEFLNLATNRFLNLYEEINSCSFMKLASETRLYKIKDFFSVYTELLAYQPIKEYIEFIEKTRPPMESVICSEFVKFVRNILAHFPFFATWDDIYISKRLINWASDGRSIDKFLKKYQGHEEVQYRFKERASGEWRYPTIKFPQAYNDDKIFLKDIANEKDGILLCAVLMYKVVSSQIIQQPERI